LPRRSAQPNQPDQNAEEALPRAPRRAAKPRAMTAAGPVQGAQSPSSGERPGRGIAAKGPPVARPRARKGAQLIPAGVLPPATIPVEALRAPRGRGPFGLGVIGTALALSLALHALALAIHFSSFDLRHLADKGPPLEIALVNARSSTRPSKADILAQANLDGGGNTDADRRAKTPLPVMPKESAQNEVALATQKVEALEQQTRELLTQLRSVPVATPQPTPSDAPATDSPTANDVMQRTLEAIRLEAQIAKDMDAYQKRPKRRFVGARAAEYRFARYVEDWRMKVERVGNLNYPEAARAKRLYGKLLLTVSIRSDGSIEKVEVNRSSGQRILDAAAVKIVQMAAPYAPFPPDIRRDTDILAITRTWTFAKGNELRSE
jgi:protein TonB